MKGLYVYGALCMTLSFVVGMQAGNHLLMAAALASCALSALGEVATEILDATDQRYPSLIVVQAAVSILSWLVTAVAVVFALFVLIGG